MMKLVITYVHMNFVYTVFTFGCFKKLFQKGNRYNLNFFMGRFSVDLIQRKYDEISL